MGVLAVVTTEPAQMTECQRNMEINMADTSVQFICTARSDTGPISFQFYHGNTLLRKGMDYNYSEHLMPFGMVVATAEIHRGTRFLFGMYECRAQSGNKDVGNCSWTLWTDPKKVVAPPAEVKKSSGGK